MPSIWVDRAGAKVTVTEQYTRQSKLTAGLVIEEVTTRDEQGDPCPCGMRASNNPGMGGEADGPPTTFSETGTDRIAFVQVSLRRNANQIESNARVDEPIRRTRRLRRAYVGPREERTGRERRRAAERRFGFSRRRRT